jgi:hypothetical protein
VAAIDVPHNIRETEAWRRLLSPAQLAEIDKVAGQQLRRVGYGDLRGQTAGVSPCGAKFASRGCPSSTRPGSEARG